MRCAAGLQVRCDVTSKLRNAKRGTDHAHAADLHNLAGTGDVRGDERRTALGEHVLSLVSASAAETVDRRAVIVCAANREDRIRFDQGVVASIRRERRRADANGRRSGRT